MSIKSEMVLRFNSIDELTNVVCHPKNIGNRYSTGKSWLGGDCETNADVYKLVEEGWPDGVEEILKLQAEMEIPEPVSRRRKIKRGWDGNDFDIHAVYSGNINKCWVKRTRQNKRGPQCVSVCVDIGANAGVSASRLFWRGASALVIVDELLKAGYKVEVIAFERCGGVFKSGSAPSRLTVEVVVKDFDAPLELNSLVASCALAGFYRVHTWKAEDSCPYKVSSGRGWAINETPKHLRGEMVIHNFHECYDKETSEKFINQEFDRLVNKPTKQYQTDVVVEDY
jgi:hypothetical protein